MKKSHVSFGEVQKLLQQLGFIETCEREGWRFEHTDSRTVFLFRPYRPTDRVYEHDLFLVRSQFSARGMMGGDAFDELLAKSPA